MRARSAIIRTDLAAPNRDHGLFAQANGWELMNWRSFDYGGSRYLAIWDASRPAPVGATIRLLARDAVRHCPISATLH